MTLKESITIVNLLHSAYPQDRKATKADLSQRAESFQIALADYDFETVRRAAQHIIATSKWHPTTAELIVESKKAKLVAPVVTPITTAKPVDDEKLEAYLDAFCEWIGFGGEPNDNVELPQGVMNYEK